MIWHAALARETSPDAAAQMGFFYGEDNGETALFPLVMIYKGLVLNAPADILALVRTDGWGNDIVCLPNLVPLIEAGGTAQEVFDKAKEQLTAIFGYLEPAPSSLSRLQCRRRPMRQFDRAALSHPFRVLACATPNPGLRLLAQNGPGLTSWGLSGRNQRTCRRS